MKRIKKVLSFILVTVLSLGVFALVGCKKTDEPIEELSVNNLVITPNVTNGIELVTLNSEVVETDAGAYITKTLEATILREDGTNSGECSWSVYWGENALDEDVTNYIQVSPQTIKTKAFIYCYKPFTGSTIIVEVTATETGDKATCVCEYVGVPDRIYAELDGEKYTTSNTLVLNSGTYTFDLGLANVFGSVDSSNANFEVKEIYGNGKFLATSNTVGGSDNVTSTDITVEMSEAYTNFVSASIDGNILTINVWRTVNSYYVSGSRGWVEFKDFHYDPRGGGAPTSCDVRVLLRENVLGKEILLNIRPLDTAKLNTINLTF